MKMYKIMRTKSDGMLYSVSVNRHQPYNIDEWMTAEYHLTKKFNDKKGFYGFEKPNSMKYKENLQRGDHRVWVECEVEDWEIVYSTTDKINWVIAQRMKILRALSKSQVGKILVEGG